jgi:hypothetical protein
VVGITEPINTSFWREGKKNKNEGGKATIAGWFSSFHLRVGKKYTVLIVKNVFFIYYIFCNFFFILSIKTCMSLSLSMRCMYCELALFFLQLKPIFV